MLRIAFAVLAATSLAAAGFVAVSPPESKPESVSAAATSPDAPELPTVEDTKPRDYAGIHNVVAYFKGYLSGSVPEGDEGFDTLAKMGIKTIISVDGAVPEVEKAKARGIRYIHLPIGYNGFDEKRKLELVRASRDAMKDGPVYVHCHHGKHRSAGAAGAVAASLGWLKANEALDRMKVSGTSPGYKGLYKCTADSTTFEKSIIDAVPSEFPEVSQPATFVKSMVEIDHVNDHLKAIEKAGWVTPRDHPDLVPVAEAGRMADLFRLAMESDKVKSQSSEFALMMKENGELAQTLEDLLLAEAKDVKKLSDTIMLIQASCKDCHMKYRD